MDRAGRVLSPGALAIDGRDIVGIDTPDAIGSRFSARETVESCPARWCSRLDQHAYARADGAVSRTGRRPGVEGVAGRGTFSRPRRRPSPPEFVRAGTRLAALKMIQSDTTMYTDMYYFEEEIARVTKDAGLRGVLGETIIQFPVSDAKMPASKGSRARRRSSKRSSTRRADRAGARAALDVHARRGHAQGHSRAGRSPRAPR